MPKKGRQNARTPSSDKDRKKREAEAKKKQREREAEQKRKQKQREAEAKKKQQAQARAQRLKNRNQKQTARRIPAKVGATSTAPLTQVVAPDGSRGGEGAYAQRRSPAEIKAEKEAQARATLGISDFPQPIRQATRPAPRRVQEPVGGFTGLTSGYGIKTNEKKELEGKLNDMEARLKAEIEKQNQPNNPAQDPAPAQRQKPQRGVLRRGEVQARRPPPKQELENVTTFISPEEQARRRAEARVREQNKRTRPFNPLPVTAKGEQREKDLVEEKRVQDIRIELDRQTKAVEEEKRVQDIRVELDRQTKAVEEERKQKAEEEKRVQDIRDELDRQTKAVEEERKQIEEPFNQARRLVEAKQKEQKEQSKIVDDIMGGEKEKEIQLTAEQENFKVGGEIEVPFKSQEELLEAFRNRPNQPKPLEVVEVEEVDSDDDFKSVEGFDEDGFGEIEPDEETTEAFNQARELYNKKQKEKIENSKRSHEASQREKPKENDPQNILNVSSLRKDIKDSFGSQSLFKLREEQTEREKTKEDFGGSSIATLRREQAERERLRTRPLPPTPERPLPVPPNLREREAPRIASEIVDDVVDRAFDTATENAKRLEKERKEKQRKDREEERKRIAREVAGDVTLGLIGGGISGAVDTQQRRDRGGARAERDRSRRTATADVTEIIDDLVDRSIVQGQAKENQVRASGQGRRGTDIERELRNFRKANSRGGGFPDRPLEGDVPRVVGQDPDLEDRINLLRERFEARQITQDEKNSVLGALMNFGVNGQYIPFNARDLLRITNTANDKAQINRLRDLIRTDRRPEVRKLENEIISLADRFLKLKKQEKDDSNKIAKLRKFRR